jgi:hypothetical protein
MLLITYMFLSPLRPLSGCSTSLLFKYKRIAQLHFTEIILSAPYGFSVILCIVLLPVVNNR